MRTTADPPYHKIVVLGATGFVGRALIPALLGRGYAVRACARRVPSASERANLEYVPCDLLDPATLPYALAGMDAAYYLVHSLGSANLREAERHAASSFAQAAASAGLSRIVYLGGVAPRGVPSEHLATRLEVGEILRAGPVPTIELRAAMIVGVGSASWQIVRDLAMRLPIMVLPAWLSSKLSPIAIDDVVHALLDALEIPLPISAHYDIPGPSLVSGKEILERIAALEGRRLVTISLPWLTPKLSALWLRLVTRGDYALSRELVLGLGQDLLPADRRFWELSRYSPKITFDAAAQRAIQDEQRDPTHLTRLAMLEESLVRHLGPKLRST